MKQDIINKIQDIIGNQSTDEREILLQLKGVHTFAFAPDAQSQLKGKIKRVSSPTLYL